MSVARHTVYNLAGAIVPAAVLLATVPFYLKVIGLDRYGLLSICWLFVGYFGLFDFGLGRATAQKIAKLSKSTEEERSRIFWTSALLSLLLSLIAVAIFIPVAGLGLGAMKVENAGLRSEIITALPWLIAAVPLVILQSLCSGALEGRREFLKINVINSIGAIGTGVFPLVGAYFVSPHLSVLVAAALAGRLLSVIGLLVASIGAVPVSRLRVAPGNEVRGLLRFGGWTTVTGIIGPLLVFSDRFAIGIVLGAAVVGLYVIPFNLVSQLGFIPSSLAAALFPRLAAAADEEAKSLGKDALMALAFSLTLFTVLMMAAVGPFLDLWAGAKIGHAAFPVAIILLIGFWANGLARIPFASLQAKGRPDSIALVHVAEILPYLALLYIGMKSYGLVGAALAWSARNVVDLILLGTMDRMDRGAAKLLAILAALLACFALLGLSVPSEPWIRLPTLGLAAVICGAILLWQVPPTFTQRIRTHLASKRSPS